MLRDSAPRSQGCVKEHRADKPRSTALAIDYHPLLGGSRLPLCDPLRALQLRRSMLLNDEMSSPEGEEPCSHPGRQRQCHEHAEQR